eukprot:TRINITY_DN8374_c0_g1_i2.p1 TRINITY_DN8374_c0_g1~~TRINITY_DN8374_c0_g1_i2.p1  ORF type:complete len:329 (-),score=79.53 TRINITY_DN8374_c0_g1_i2:91-1077(-)
MPRISVNQQRAFVVVAFFALIGVGYIGVKSSESIVAKKKSVHPELLGQPEDLLVAGSIAFVIIFIKTAIEQLAMPLTVFMKRQAKWDKSELEHRKIRFCNNIYYTIIYIFLTTFGWKVMRSKSWAPSWYIPGAHGDSANAATDYLSHSVEPDVKFYYMLQLGYTLSSLYDVLIAKKHRHDFFEMMLHHFVTIFLIVFSFFTGFTRIGTLVLLVHDPVDVFAFGARTLADSIYENTLGAFAFFCLVLSWGFFRLIAFPFSVIKTVIFDMKYISVEHDASSCHIFFISLLSTLLVLHVYWFSHFPKFIINGIKGNLKSEEVNEDDADKED